jgi:hypothetical protein
MITKWSIFEQVKYAYALTPDAKRIIESTQAKQLYDGIQRNIDDVSPLYKIIKKNGDPRASLKSTDSKKPISISGIINIYKTHTSAIQLQTLVNIMKDRNEIFNTTQIWYDSFSTETKIKSDKAYQTK